MGLAILLTASSCVTADAHRATVIQLEQAQARERALQERVRQLDLITVETGAVHSGDLQARRPAAIVTLTKANEIYLLNKKLDPAQVEAEIRAVLAEFHSDTVLFRGDRSVTLEAVVDVLSAAKRAGARNIAILTARADGGGH